ncbi:MAG: hypothetical protein JSV85_04485 [Candidatus Bathyarchaeota archaeon]|nr:MAG: hypothetical protein JSV85_04485 [Candidatus Bathyarchaeota archaeon]
MIKSTEFVRQFVKQTEGTSGQPSILTPKILKRSPKRKIKELEMQVDPIPLHLVEMIEQAKVKLGSSK